VGELREKYGDKILPQVIEERTVLQSAQGAGRPIHGWPGESAIEIAQVFDRVLERVQLSLGQPSQSRLGKSSRKVLRLNRVMRGQTLDEVLKLEKEEPTDEIAEILGVLPPEAETK
jgi:hypothetical protein